MKTKSGSPLGAHLRSLLIVIALISVAGCASFPMGLSKNEWESLGPDKQAEYRARQFEIDEQNRNAEQARRLEQERVAAEQARSEQERIAALYAHARYGDIVNITLSSGLMIDGRNRYTTEPVSFDLVRGERKTIKVPGSNGKQYRIDELRARMSDDANTVYLNEKNIGMDRVALVNRTWDRGETFALSPMKNDWGVVFSGMTARLRLKSLSGEPPRLIIDHRP
jgi:hypothetical protein